MTLRHVNFADPPSKYTTDVNYNFEQIEIGASGGTSITTPSFGIKEYNMKAVELAAGVEKVFPIPHTMKAVKVDARILGGFDIIVENRLYSCAGSLVTIPTNNQTTFSVLSNDDVVIDIALIEKLDYTLVPRPT